MIVLEGTKLKIHFKHDETWGLNQPKKEIYNVEVQPKR
jgi:hypothetical protein